MLHRSETESVRERLRAKGKLFYAPLISGHIEIATYEFMRGEGFELFTLPELSESSFPKRGELIFEIGHGRFELSACSAMRLSVLSAAYDKVYSLSRAFRCEERDDNNRLLEFKILEAEWKTPREEELFELLERYLYHIVACFDRYIVERGLSDIFDAVELNLPLRRRTYDSVLAELADKGIVPSYGDDGYFDAEVSSSLSAPCFITYYPSKCSWRARIKDDRLSYAHNLLLPSGYGEAADLSMRETSLGFYEKRFKEAGILEHYKWYMSGIGCDEAPRVGFGLGIERVCAWLMKLDDIGDQLWFPRYPNILKGEG